MVVSPVAVFFFTAILIVRRRSVIICKRHAGLYKIRSGVLPPAGPNFPVGGHTALNGREPLCEPYFLGTF